MNIPGLGEMSAFQLHRRAAWQSAPIHLPLSNGRPVRIAVVGYETDPDKENFHWAISNILQSGPATLRAAESHIFDYYQDCNANWEPDDVNAVAIASPQDVWNYIELGDFLIARRRPENGVVYFSFACECDWEPESGLEIVFENGTRVNKIGPHDDCLTHADATGDESLANVVYPRA